MKWISEPGVGPRRLGLRAYAACIPYPDVLVPLGSPRLWVPFALGRPSAEQALAAAVFAAAS